eukprot:360874-Chlamydomonas_euryale.AAC.21
MHACLWPLSPFPPASRRRNAGIPAPSCCFRPSAASAVASPIDDLIYGIAAAAVPYPEVLGNKTTRCWPSPMPPIAKNELLFDTMLSIILVELKCEHQSGTSHLCPMGRAALHATIALSIDMLVLPREQARCPTM